MYNLILLLGGKSSRFQNDINKVYCLINNKPIFLYSLDTFLKFDCINKIIIVYNENDLNIINKYLKDYDHKRIVLTSGGSERYISVMNGLKLCDSNKVIVHDGARPNISYETIDKALKEADKYDCLSVGIRVCDTIKKVTDNCFETIQRDNLFIMQTPQITNTKLLNDCLNKVKEEDNITDDLMAIEKYSGIIPHIVIGERDNIKITNKEDFEIISILLNKRKEN